MKLVSPEFSKKTPKVKMNMKSPEIELPDMPQGKHNVSINAPRADLSMPNVSYEAPNIKKPQYNATIPEVNLKMPTYVPDVRMQQANVSIPKIDMNRTRKVVEYETPNVPSMPKVKANVPSL